MHHLEIEPIKELPKPNWKLPQKTVYVGLGCAACPSQVCFSATDRKGTFAFGGDAWDELKNITDMVDRYRDVHRGATSDIYSDSKFCDGSTCGREEEIGLAAQIINETYGINLQVGGK